MKIINCCNFALIAQLVVSVQIPPTGAGIMQFDQARCNILQQPVSNSTVSFAGYKHPGSAGLYVNEENKFAFCSIEKNGCSHWVELGMKLDPGSIDKNRAYDHDYGIMEHTYTQQKAESVFNDPKAVRAVFVRDPLERFLSGFLNKCLEGNCKGHLCVMRGDFEWGRLPPFSHAVDWARRNHAAQRMHIVNPHFAPQADHCELRTRLHEYNIIGHMKPDSLAQDVKCFFEQIGHPDWFVDRKGGDLFDLQRESQPQEEREAFLQDWFTREAAEEMYNIYKVDYDLFKLPRPSWIEKAHGRLYNVSDAQDCNSHPVMLRVFRFDGDITDEAYDLNDDFEQSH